MSVWPPSASCTRLTRRPRRSSSPPRQGRGSARSRRRRAPASGSRRRPSITSCAPPEPQLSQWSISSTGRAGIGEAERLRARDRLGERRRAKHVLVAAVPRDLQHVRRTRRARARGRRGARRPRRSPTRRCRACRRAGTTAAASRRARVPSASHRRAKREDVAGRPVLRRVPHDRREERLPAPRHHRLDRAVERADEDAAGEHARLVHVDVRVGLVAGDHGGVVDQRRATGWCGSRASPRSARRGAMRRRRCTISPSASSQSSITIAPCRSRKTASQPARTASSSGRTSVSNVARDALFDGHDFGGDRRHDLRVLAPREVEVRGHRRVGALEARARFVAVRGPFAVAERRERRGERRERVGLVLDERDDEAALSSGYDARSAASVGIANAGPPGFSRSPGAAASSGTSSDRPSPARARRPRAPRARSAGSRRGNAPSS